MARRGRSIVLIGMMGGGKSSVGRALGERTGLPRLDMDELIVAKAGLSIPQIFEAKREAWFRDLESAVLLEIQGHAPAIIVTGGGVVLRRENVEILQRMGPLIWLDASADTLFGRAVNEGDRPLLQTADPRITFSEILALRLPLYASAADIRVDTTHLTPNEAAALILARLKKQSRNAPP
jgi:shikimate kinase